MPSNRRLRVTGFIVVLTVLIVLYVTNGARSTYESPFYTRTVAAIQNRHDSEAREAIIADEKARSERVARIQEEHEKAMESKVPVPGDAGRAAGNGVGESKQKPMVEDVKEGAEHVKEGAKKAGEHVAEGVKNAQEAVAPEAAKSVAGRKKMPDGKVVVNEKESANDGVAKVGNTGAKESSVAKNGDQGPETEEEHKVEVELDSILKKGPIIIFSKSYCPFSKKAKHILLDLYTITPPPYVVELDQHELGPGLQSALQKTTGRRTVPNVLINGKSIGGGDDVAALHADGKLAETVKAMGGKRVMEVKPKPQEQEKREVKFRA